MIVVDVRLVSAVSRSRDRHLGTLTICNDGTGATTKGNYTANFTGANGGKGKSGVVHDYPRANVAIWNLIRRACFAAGYNK